MYRPCSVQCVRLKQPSQYHAGCNQRATVAFLERHSRVAHTICALLWDYHSARTYHPFKKDSLLFLVYNFSLSICSHLIIITFTITTLIIILLPLPPLSIAPLPPPPHPKPKPLPSPREPIPSLLGRTYTGQSGNEAGVVSDSSHVSQSLSAGPSGEDTSSAGGELVPLWVG